tara:strand:+ start:1958 stop:2779 length:822 start_codon:yes stop_codon:yes gene_type:complete
VASALQLPEIPPAGPWDGYVLIVIWLPLLLRILLLAQPFRKAIMKLAPHSGWALKQIRVLPVRGFGVLALNEILAFSIPPILVLLVRTVSDPIGWSTWSDVSDVGMGVLILSLMLWVFLDLLRISRVRRMLIAIERHDVAKLRKVANVGMKARNWLQKFSLTTPKESLIEPEKNESTVERVAKRSLQVWGARVLMARKLTPQGLLGGIALGAAIEVAKAGAGKLTEAADEKMQSEFDKLAKVNTKTLLFLLARDIAMGLVPLFLLAGLPILFA